MTTTPELSLKHAVREALDDLVGTFGSEAIEVVPDGQGGAWVTIEEVNISRGPYVQDTTWLILQLQFTLPNVDIYPMWVRPDLARQDGVALGEGFSATQVQMPGQGSIPAVMLSRRTKGNFTLQTASRKVLKVVTWMVSR